MKPKRDSNRKSCVLAVTSSLSLQFVRPLAGHLAERGWTVDVVASFDDKRTPLQNSPWREHNLQMVRKPSPCKDSASFLRWVVLLSQLRPAVLVAGTPKAALLALIASKLLGIRHRVLLLHGLRAETASSWSRVLLVLFERITAKSATRIIAVSRSLAERYAAGGFSPPEKMAILGKGSAVGIDESLFEPFLDITKQRSVRHHTLSGLGLDPEKITFGYVGRMTHDKGISQLVEALKLMAAKGHQTQCLFVGEAEDSDILGDLRFLPQARAVPWTADIGSIYCCIDVLCLPSFREGMPTVVLEAAMMGVPTIGARSTGIVDAIRHGKTGLIVDQRDPALLAEAMARLAKEKRLRDTLGTNAQRYARAHFAQSDVLSRYGRYLEKLVNTTHLESAGLIQRGAP